ncbi:MAG: outer membrane beta-barrel protein [Pseudomonadota bacterium]
MTKNSIKFSALAAMSVALGSGAVVAQDDENFFIRDKYEAVTDRAQPEYDPVPIRTGAFEVRPEVDFTAGFTDNLFASGNTETDDFFVGIVPSIAFDSTWSRHSFGFGGEIDHREYTDTTSESRTNIRLQADGRIDVNSNFNLFGAVEAGDLTEPRSNIASVLNASEPVEYSRIGGEAGGQYESGRLRVRGAVGLQTYDYDDVELNNGLIQDQDFRDRDEISARLRVSYAVERDWAVFAELIRNEDDYDPPNVFNALNRDSEGTIVRVGTDFELQSLLRGDIGVGYFQSEYDDPTLVDVDGASVAANLQWFVTQLTTVSGTAGRAVIDPGLVQTNAAVRTNVGARADHELRRNVILTGEARFTNYEYENIDRDDDRIDLRVAAVWKVNPNIWLDGSYELTDQSSNVQDFSENRVLFGIRIFP